MLCPRSNKDYPDACQGRLVLFNTTLTLAFSDSDNYIPTKNQEDNKSLFYLPPLYLKRAADLVGDSWTTGPETPMCWNPAAAGQWRTGDDCSSTQ